MTISDKVCFVIYVVNLFIFFMVLCYSVILIVILKVFGDWSCLMAFLFFSSIILYVFFMVSLNQEKNDKSEEDK